MPKITYLDPEDTGTVTWYGRQFGPNKSVTVDAKADAELLAAASVNSKFFKVSGLTGDDKQAADDAKAEADALAEREAAALRAQEEADQAAADAERAASEEFTKPGQTEADKADAAPTTKKPGAR